MAHLQATERDIVQDLQSAQARNERVEAELQEARLKVEVLTAKGTMYDHLSDKAEQMETKLGKVGRTPTQCSSYT
jgi:hypothetical protein